MPCFRLSKYWCVNKFNDRFAFQPVGLKDKDLTFAFFRTDAGAELLHLVVVELAGNKSLDERFGMDNAVIVEIQMGIGHVQELKRLLQTNIYGGAQKFQSVFF